MVADGVIESRNLRHVRIVDHAALNQLLTMLPSHRKKGDGEDLTHIEEDIREE